LHGVAYEKSLLLKHLQPQGWCALGEGVRKQLPDAIEHDCIETFVGWELQGKTLTLRYQDETACLSLPLPAPHWGSNMAFVASVAIQYLLQHQRHISLAELSDILAQSLSGINGSVILDDSYNANPISMQAALHTLAAMPKAELGAAIC